MAGRLDQLWTLRPVGGDYYQIVNEVSGLCLGVQGFDTPALGTRVEVYHCAPAPPEKVQDTHWRFVGTQIRNYLHGYCLGVQGYDTLQAGELAEVFNCEASAEDALLDSHWTRTTYDDGRTTLANGARRDLCLGVQGSGNHQSAALVGVYPCLP
jgi:Ricin-type beta-trefoil lectin domain-like